MILKYEIDEHMPNHVQVQRLKDLMSNPPKDERPVCCTITPNLARHILADPTISNVDNRKRSKPKVAQYAEAMKKGQWSLTGDTLKFSHKLEDGQHRLQACSDSGKPFSTHVMFGLDDEIFYRLDQGKVRDRSDVFQIAGIKYFAVTSAATRWVRILKEETGRGAFYTPEQLLKYFQSKLDNDTFKFFVKIAVSAKTVSKIPPAPLIAKCYIKLEEGADRKALIQFINDTGNPTAKPSSAGAVCREALAELKKKREGRLHEDIRTDILDRCLDAHLVGKKVTRGKLVARWP